VYPFNKELEHFSRIKDFCGNSDYSQKHEETCVKRLLKANLQRRRSSNYEAETMKVKKEYLVRDVKKKTH